MLRWTPSGAVAAPETVQIRVQRSYPGRIRAGAPVPTRSLSPAELESNLRYFTEGLRGPRSRPCVRLVLSGVGVASRPDLAAALDLARELGLEHTVLHVGPEDLADLDVAPLAGRVAMLVLPVQPVGSALDAAARALGRAAEAGLPVAANTVLSAEALAALSAAARLLASAAPRQVTFTYPFPVDEGVAASLPLPAEALAALGPALRILEAAGVQAVIKGLPACHLGAEADRLRRTSNRWYVDADHQREEALLFFPDVVRFHKEDLCRFCERDASCDGSFAAWLRRPGVPPLRPIGS